MTAHLGVMIAAWVRCGRYGFEKPLEAFGFRYKARQIPHTVCRECPRAYRHAYDARLGPTALRACVRVQADRYRDRNRLYLDSFLRDHPCIDCGEAAIVVLEFDHVRGRKTSALSLMAARGTSLDALQLELAKCEVRCANCHRRRTAHAHHRRRARLHSQATELDDRSKSR